MHLLIKPIITEKTNLATQVRNVYTFLVDPRSNKIEIKKELQFRYIIDIVSIRTMIYRPKIIQKTKKQKIIWGKTNKVKKAMITLKIGQKIEFFSQNH